MRERDQESMRRDRERSFLKSAPRKLGAEPAFLWLCIFVCENVQIWLLSLLWIAIIREEAAAPVLLMTVHLPREWRGDHVSAKSLAYEIYESVRWNTWYLGWGGDVGGWRAFSYPINPTSSAFWLWEKSWQDHAGSDFTGWCKVMSLAEGLFLASVVRVTVP